jgi:hypothetical protein
MDGTAIGVKAFVTVTTPGGTLILDGCSCATALDDDFFEKIAPIFPMEVSACVDNTAMISTEEG